MGAPGLPNTPPRSEPFLGFCFFFALGGLTASVGSLDLISRSLASEIFSNQPVPITQRAVICMPCRRISICLTSLVPTLTTSSFHFSLSFGQNSSRCLTSSLGQPHTHPAVLTVGTLILYRKWLRPIYPVRSCTAIELSAFRNPE